MGPRGRGAAGAAGADATTTRRRTRAATRASGSEGERPAGPPSLAPRHRAHDQHAGLAGVLLALELLERVEDQAHGRPPLAERRALESGDRAKRAIRVRGPSRPSGTSRADLLEAAHRRGHLRLGVAEAARASLAPRPRRRARSVRMSAGSGHQTTASRVHSASIWESGASIAGRSPTRHDRGALVEAEEGDEAGVAASRVEHLEHGREVEGSQLLEVRAQRRARERASAPRGLDPRGRGGEGRSPRWRSAGSRPGRPAARRQGSRRRGWRGVAAGRPRRCRAGALRGLRQPRGDGEGEERERQRQRRRDEAVVPAEGRRGPVPRHLLGRLAHHAGGDRPRALHVAGEERPVADEVHERGERRRRARWTEASASAVKPTFPSPPATTRRCRTYSPVSASDRGARW